MSEDQIKISELKAEYQIHGLNFVKDWNREIISGTADWGSFLYWNPCSEGDGYWFEAQEDAEREVWLLRQEFPENNYWVEIEE